MSAHVERLEAYRSPVARGVARRQILNAGGAIAVAIASGCSDAVRPQDLTASRDAAASVATSDQSAEVHVGDTVHVVTRLSETGSAWTVRNDHAVALVSSGTVVALAPGESYVVATVAAGWHIGEQDSALVIVALDDSAPTPADSTAVDSTAVDSTAADSTKVGSTAVDSTRVDSTSVDSTSAPGDSNPVDVDSTATSTPPVPEERTTPTGPTVTLEPGQNIQSAVDANPGGTVFLLRPGTYLNQRIVPKKGNVFYGQPGAVLDGTNTTAYAFDLGGSPYPDSVRIHGLKITGYASSSTQGAIRSTPGGRGVGPRGWVVDSNEVSYNAAVGILVGMGMHVFGNNVHHNGQLGLGGNPDNSVVENNELAWNNYEKQYRMTFEAGGIKLAVGSGNVVRNNYVHDNWGAGIWFDIDMSQSLIEGNRVENNADAGIFYEISYDAVIRNNTVTKNGFGNAKWLYGAGIFISSSKNVEVYGNTVTNNARGITAVMQDRGSGARGLREVTDLYVHDNRITMSEQGPCMSGACNQTGFSQDIGNKSYFTTMNNRFERNRYTLGSATGAWFTWNDRDITATQWRAAGHDVDGTFAP